ncbi:MAG: GmrSD restriction endonuclease domain-containing protein [bacterium]
MQKNTEKVDKIFELIEDNILVLPNFQRDFTWKPDQQKKLAASFFVGIPIGGFLFLKGDKESFASKKLGFQKGLITPAEECSYLLDGQQRISVLKSIFSDLFIDCKSHNDVRDRCKDLYSRLNNRWFIKIYIEKEKDIFGWEKLKFNKKLFRKIDPEEIMDFFVKEDIYMEANKTEWFHPSYSYYLEDAKKMGDNQIMGLIGDKAAEQRMVPLYTIYNDSKMDERIHRYALNTIAENRVKQLKLMYKDDRINIEDILGYIRPNIKQLVEDDDTDAINNAWYRLAANWSKDVSDFLEELVEKELRILELPSEEVNRAISIFEHINTGGTELDTFDLIVARAAYATNKAPLSDRIKSILLQPISLSSALTNDLIGITDELKSNWFVKTMEVFDGDKIQKSRIKDQFLNLLSVFSHCRNVSEIKTDHLGKNKILSLKSVQINSNAKKTVKSLVKAAAFLHFRCGVTKITDLNYALMIIPIAYMLQNDEIWNNPSKLNKIEYWYWCSLFGGAYREYQKDQCVSDIKDLYHWLNVNENKFEYLEERVLNSVDYSNLELLLKKDKHKNIRTAIHKGILQYGLSRQPKDFLKDNSFRLSTWKIATNVTIDDTDKILNINEHHIYPLAGANKLSSSADKLRNNKEHILNSPLNLTYISSYANNLIKEKTPNEYLDYLSEVALNDHFIPINYNIEYQKKPNETDVDFYERILTTRYKAIIRKISSELDRLKS